MMFAVHCPRHQSTVLMTRRNAVSFWNGPDGPVIRWKCRCGHEGLLTRHGSTPDRMSVAPTEPPARTPEEAGSLPIAG